MTSRVKRGTASESWLQFHIQGTLEQISARVGFMPAKPDESRVERQWVCVESSETAVSGCVGICCSSRRLVIWDWKGSGARGVWSAYGSQSLATELGLVVS